MIVKTKIAAALSVALLTVGTTATAEVTLFDFTEASSAYKNATLDGTFGATGGNQGQTGYDATLNLDYNRVISTPNRDLKVEFDAGGSVNRGTTNGASSSSTYNATGRAEVNNYFRPNSKGLFWYGSGDFGLLKGAESVYSKIGVGLGYGRVVNLTPMAKSIRLIEALRKQGSMKADPGKSTYVQVAKLIALQEEYKSKYRTSSNYAQQWIADIEKVLVASGQVNGALGAAGAIKAHDVLINENFFERRHGWKVNSGIGLVLTNYDGTDGGDPTLDLIEAEYHRPLSNRTQFSNTSGLSLDFGDDDTGYNLTNTMALTYELTDQIDWENKWILGYNKSGSNDSSNDFTSNILRSQLIYELNNKLDLKLTATATDMDDEDDTNNNEEIDTDLNLSVSYSLD